MYMAMGQPGSERMCNSTIPPRMHTFFFCFGDAFQGYIMMYLPRYQWQHMSNGIHKQGKQLKLRGTAITDT